MIFDGYLGQPQILRPSRWKVISFLQGPQSNSQNAGNPIKNTQYNIKHAGSQGYENTRMQNEKQRTPGYRIEEMLRSLVAPLPRGRRIKFVIRS